jgi:hypothetical protein
MRVKRDADVESLINHLRSHARTFSEGYGNANRAQWYANRVDELETICRNSMEDTELADGLLTDRYWHILQDSVSDSVYGADLRRGARLRPGACWPGGLALGD